MMLSAPIWRWLDTVRHRYRVKHMDLARALGMQGEDLAHRYLQRRGYLVVQRNWRSRAGLVELDLVAWQKGDPDRLVIVEVKSRRTMEGGAPERNIGRDKRQSMRWAAREFCRMARVEVDMVRFGTIQIVFEPELEVEHQVDAFGWREL